MIPKYPGAKSRLLKTLIPAILEANKTEYREPFAGSGKVFTELVKHHAYERIWINDKFPAVASFWAAVHQHPDDLVKKLAKVKMWRDMPISVNSYLQRREEARSLDRLPKAKTDLLHHAVNLFVVLVQSFDGNLQTTRPTRVVNRWYPPNYTRKITELAKHLRKAKTAVTAGDFAPLLEGEGDAVVYLDPPYYKMGDRLYPHSFNGDDHFRLVKSLRNSKCRWLLSYDVHDVVEMLYQWATVEKVKIRYSGNGKGQAVNRWAEELLIRG